MFQNLKYRNEVFVRKLFSCLLTLIFIFTCTASVHALDAKKRKTRTLVLENGLAVLMTYDPDVHRSAAALSVGVGQLHDPEEKMGLAHYLEHMLFLGTQKFPEAGSYKKFLNENSGSSNAYTAAAQTNYFFEISHDAFEGAVDRFSDFFKAPLFDPQFAGREVNAVSSEHDKNKRSDGWRASYVKDLISEPGHPMRKFGTGNTETLAGDNRPALLAFYKKYYAASNMKLAVISSMSLDAQTALVKKYFSGIPDFPVQQPFIDPNFRKPLKGKFRLLKIKAIKDIRSLELDFPTIPLNKYQDSKPANILGSIIGHEGQGSLLSRLKEEGLVLGLSAGGGASHPNLNSFSVNVSLTQKGLDEYERILELTFSYLKMLQEEGIKEYTYLENETMAQIDFDWKDPDEGMGFVSGRAAMMQEYPLDEIETLPFLFKKYDPAVYKKLLATLSPENCMVTLTADSVETDQTEKFYGTEYSVREVGGEIFQKLMHPSKIAELRYPAPNEFIPRNLQMVEEEPHLVRDDALARVWSMFDHRFNQPKVMMQFRIETPKIYDTVEHLMLSKLYEAAFKESLNEKVYPIQLAGLSYGLGLERKGVNLSIGGYSERTSDLLKLVIHNLLEVDIDEEKFANIKEAMIRDLNNGKLGQAYARAGYYGTLLWMEAFYSEEERLKAIESLTLTQVKSFVKELYEKVYITGMAYGNLSDDKVRETVQTLLDQIKSKPLPESERFKTVVEVLKPGEGRMFSRQVLDNNNSLDYTLQVGENSYNLFAKLTLVSSLLESDFYTQMRTKQQLGYIVWSYRQKLEDRLFLKFVIQSATHSPFELARRVEAWMVGLGALFDSLSDEDFEKHRASIIVSLKKEGESIGEVANDYYYLATEEKGDFQYKQKLIAEVERLSKEEVIALARSLLFESRTPRLAILMRSKDNDEKVPDGTLTEVEQFKNRNAVKH